MYRDYKQPFFFVSAVHDQNRQERHRDSQLRDHQEGLRGLRRGPGGRAALLLPHRLLQRRRRQRQPPRGHGHRHVDCLLPHEETPALKKRDGRLIEKHVRAAIEYIGKSIIKRIYLCRKIYTDKFSLLLRVLLLFSSRPSWGPWLFRGTEGRPWPCLWWGTWRGGPRWRWPCRWTRSRGLTRYLEIKRGVTCRVM